MPNLKAFYLVWASLCISVTEFNENFILKSKKKIRSNIGFIKYIFVHKTYWKRQKWKWNEFLGILVIFLMPQKYSKIYVGKKIWSMLICSNWCKQKRVLYSAPSFYISLKSQNYLKSCIIGKIQTFYFKRVYLTITMYKPVLK